MRKQIKWNQLWTGLILAFFVLAFSSQDSLAQKKKTPPKKTSNSNGVDSLASLEETTSWLSEKILKSSGTYFAMEEQGKTIGEENVTYPSVTFNQCQMLVSRKSEVSGRVILNSDRYTADYEVNLGDLGPASTKVISSYAQAGTAVLLNAYKEEKKIKMKSEAMRQLVGNALSEEDHFAIYLTSEEVAQRVAKAFQHAIKLCGGKVEPF